MFAMPRGAAGILLLRAPPRVAAQDRAAYGRRARELPARTCSRTAHGDLAQNQIWPQSAMKMGVRVAPDSEPRLSIVRTTSMPSITEPNTTCLPSSQGVLAVVRKNCEPLVLGPELAMLRMPG